MIKSISHIFGTEAKVKIMRLFVFNPTSTFSLKEVANRTKVNKTSTRKELKILSKAGLIKKRIRGFTLDQTYIYLAAIENFLIDASPLKDKEIIKKLSGVGNIKLILISGIFLHDRDSRVDILVVGDHIKKSKLISAISGIEAELGKEIRYSNFETPDFQYRLGIYDKLIRDILDSKNQKILNKLGV